MAQQTPVKPPPQRPRIVRTPYGWDCKMEDEASVIPPWAEPREDGSKGNLITWALVPLAIAVVAVVVFHPLTFGGNQGHPTATATAPATASATTSATPSATLGVSPSPTPDLTNPGGTDPTPSPPPSTAPPSATPSPSPAPPAVSTKHVTGAFAGDMPSMANTTCNQGGQTGKYMCEWGVHGVPGTPVQFTLTWPEATALRVTVWAPNAQKLYTGTGVGSVTTTTNLPAQADPKNCTTPTQSCVVVIVSPMNAVPPPTPATFDLAISKQQQ